MKYRMLALSTMLILSSAIQAQINEIIDAIGDGTHLLDGPGVFSDNDGNLYVSAVNTDNLFRISASSECTLASADCDVVEILDVSGDGIHIHDRTSSVAADAAGNIYVTGQFSDNAWRISNPENCGTNGPACTINQIIDANGDGVNLLDTPVAIQVDASGHVYIAGAASHNVFRVAASTTCSTNGSPCQITEIIDETGDGANIVSQPVGLAIDSQNSVFVTTQNSDNVFKIATPGSCNTTAGNCTITEIIDDSTLTTQAFGRGIAVDSEDNVYMTSLGFFEPPSVFKINTPGSCKTAGPTTCTITEIYTSVDPQDAGNIAIDDADNIYFTGGNGDNVIRIDYPVNCSTTTTPCTTTEIIDSTGDGNSILDGPGHVTIANDVDVYVSGGSSDNVFRISGAADSLDLIFRDGFY